MTLQELRKRKKLTQADCAAYLAIPLRTYQNYENNIRKQNSLKYNYMMEKLEQYGYIDEGHGILTMTKIKEICQKIFPAHSVEYAYLFGSYAKGTATEKSDVDLLVSAEITGMQFYDLVETLRESLYKNVDLLNFEQLKGNPELVNEILRDGVKIYG